MLRTRLFLNLLPFVVILLAVGLYAIALFSRLATSLDVTVAENYRSLLAAQEMSLALVAMEREIWVSLGKVNDDRPAFREQKKRFDESFASQLKGTPLPGEDKLNRQLSADYEAFQAAANRMGVATNAETRRQLYEEAIVPSVLKLSALLENIRDLNRRAILESSEKVRTITRDVRRLMIIGMAVALVISAYACYQLSRSILEPIQLLTKATAEVGAGQYDKPVPVLSRDELGELADAFNKMAGQLQEYRNSTSEELVRLHRTMETTLATFPDPIFVLDEKGRIELGNPAAADLASGLQLKDELPARLQTLAKQTLASGQDFLPHSFDEVVFYRLNNLGKFFLPRILAMRDKQRALLGVAVVLYDVTRFRLLDAAKTNLVATVSHELKTPLTSVRMALHLLLERAVGALTPKQDELLQTARADTERLLKILNDLLDLTRLEEGGAELRKENVAPVELLKGVATEMADTVSSAGLKLNWAADEKLPAVAVDRQRIGHVFTNLITNAVKYSPPGGEIVLRAASAGDHSVQFSVTDQGPGVPEEFRARIFDRFFRVPGQTKTGAGLGLSIAREITVAHGGRIGVKSEPERGSTFFVILEAANGQGRS